LANEDENKPRETQGGTQYAESETEIGTERGGGENPASKSGLGDATAVELTDWEEVERSRG